MRLCAFITFDRLRFFYAHVKNCRLTPDVSCGESLTRTEMVFYIRYIYVWVCMNECAHFCGWWWLISLCISHKYKNNCSLRRQFQNSICAQREIEREIESESNPSIIYCHSLFCLSAATATDPKVNLQRSFPLLTQRPCVCAALSCRSPRAYPTCGCSLSTLLSRSHPLTLALFKCVRECVHTLALFV